MSSKRYDGDDEESDVIRYRLTHHSNARYKLISHLGAYISNLKKLHHFRKRSKVEDFFFAICSIFCSALSFLAKVLSELPDNKKTI